MRCAPRGGLSNLEDWLNKHKYPEVRNAQLFPIPVCTIYTTLVPQNFAPMFHMFNFTFRILAISSASQCFVSMAKRQNQWCSGAGTHGNGVPTREILRDFFFIIAVKLAIFHCYHVTTFHAPQTMLIKIGHFEFAKH